MPETLLSPSNILLFGRIVEDLQIVEPTATADITVVAATTHSITQLKGHPTVDGIVLAAADEVLVKNQRSPRRNGVYAVAGVNANWTRNNVANGAIVVANGGDIQNGFAWTVRIIDGIGATARLSIRRYSEGLRRGENRQLADQLEGASFARIYGFSYGGVYVDLPRAVLLLVHGDGELVTETDAVQRARAPREPSLTGFAAADFQFADELMVWSYDKADFTIRMDVETGMFEQLLLDAELVPDDMLTSVSGAHARVSGAHARVSGAHARVSGAHARVSGAHARIRGNRGGD
jgi:hypothetical protein